MSTKSTLKIRSWGAVAGRYCILVHGGAATVADDRRYAHIQGCERAARKAAKLLEQGKSALDAVQEAVQLLESDPIFNAGKGAALNLEGDIELDASIMEGRELRAGAVCALSPFAHPIAIARAVLEDGRHVLYAATGAAEFAQKAGFKSVPATQMITKQAQEALTRMKTRGKAETWAGGTVGAVARDVQGTVAAATSTGGTAGKLPGRIGDSPIISAGTYADNRGGAASATGYGEGIIRIGLARIAVAAMERGKAPETVARDIIRELARRVTASGGVILVSKDGRLGWARSTPMMSWAAYTNQDCEIHSGD